MKTCRIAVVVPTRDVTVLRRALHSLLLQKQRPHATYVVCDNAVPAHEAYAAAKSGLRFPRNYHLDIGLELLRHKGDLGNPGLLRALALEQILRRGDIDVVAFLDDDDVLTPIHLDAIARAFRVCDGNIDVYSPLTLTYAHPGGIREPFVFSIPKTPNTFEEVTDVLVKQWVEYARHGAAFAVTTAALQRFGMVVADTAEDEWVRFFPEIAMKGATFGETGAVGSYVYNQHVLSEDQAARRRLHALTRPRTVRGALLRGFVT